MCNPCPLNYTATYDVAGKYLADLTSAAKSKPMTLTTLCG